MMELPVTVMGDKMHTMETARNTETGLTSSRVSILVTVGMSVVVTSPATVVGSVSVTSADIVALRDDKCRSTRFSLHLSGQVPFVNASSSVRRHDGEVFRAATSRRDHVIVDGVTRV